MKNKKPVGIYKGLYYLTGGVDKLLWLLLQIKRIKFSFCV